MSETPAPITAANYDEFILAAKRRASDDALASFCAGVVVGEMLPRGVKLTDPLPKGLLEIYERRLAQKMVELKDRWRGL